MSQLPPSSAFTPAFDQSRLRKGTDGYYFDPATGKKYQWTPHRDPLKVFVPAPVEADSFQFSQRSGIASSGLVTQERSAILGSQDLLSGEGASTEATSVPLPALHADDSSAVERTPSRGNGASSIDLAEFQEDGLPFSAQAYEDDDALRQQPYGQPDKVGLFLKQSEAALVDARPFTLGETPDDELSRSGNRQQLPHSAFLNASPYRMPLLAGHLSGVDEANEYDGESEDAFELAGGLHEAQLPSSSSSVQRRLSSNDAGGPSRAAVLNHADSSRSVSSTQPPTRVESATPVTTAEQTNEEPGFLSRVASFITAPFRWVWNAVSGLGSWLMSWLPGNKKD